jgi:hypothetical protein
MNILHTIIDKSDYFVRHEPDTDWSGFKTRLSLLEFGD